MKNWFTRITTKGSRYRNGQSNAAGTNEVFRAQVGAED